jgi:hypothetical protein
MVPRYGVTIFELLSDFIEKELRFVRREPLDVRLPSFSGSASLFLASVFGVLPAKAQVIFDKHFAPELSAKTVPCVLADFSTFLRPTILFLRRFGMFGLEAIPRGFRRGDTVFLLDATNSLDVIDYWNLRALGRAVVPFPIQCAESEAVRTYAREFIENF